MVLDRTEMHNVATEHPTITRELSVAWDDWKVRSGVRTWHPKTGYRVD